MTFKNYPCWKNDMVSQVMNTDALDMPDHQFLATHHPVKMYRVNLLSDEKGLEYDERRLLHDFMATPEYNFITILGESGAGKSHLVRWLYANIPTAPNRRVLLIRKARTNLKEIVRVILQNLDGQKFDDYRRRLLEGTDTLSPEQARQKLLHFLIEAVGPYAERSETISDEEDYIMQGLPDMLSDPFFQRKLLVDDGILHKLTIHIIGDSGKIERLEERQQFKLEDLPLNVRDIGKAGHHAQEFYSNIVADEYLKQKTVDWINYNLDAAIAQVLTFRGEDLFNLMLDVREALAEQGQELVLLIEDFAKLQGIDTQLLESLLVRPNQGDRRLCKLRSALASTTGYFIKLPDTVQTRIAFRVNLDINKEGTEKILSNNDVFEFTARYLNAVRLDDTALRSWHASGDVTIGQERDPLPSACHECTHMGPCHEAFGAVQEMGLYPFNDRAIINMLGFVSQKQFNPRFFIDKALRHALYNYRDSLATGQFPPMALLEHFTRPDMGAPQKNELKRKDPKNYERRQALLELWADPEIISDLHPIIHSSFDLSMLGAGQANNGDDIIILTEPARPLLLETAKPDTEPVPVKLQERIQQINEWQNKSELGQDLAQYLREILFFSICSHIDWDSELLVKAHFVGSRRSFQQKCIIFKNQGTAVAGQQDVTLHIPLADDSLTDAALALQGVLYFNHYRHWQFPEGPLYLRAYIRHMEKWSRYVLEQVKKTVNDKDDWDPVPSVVELLDIGSRMAGLQTSNLEERINAMFNIISPSTTANRSPKWQNLYRQLASTRQVEDGSSKKGLTDILLSRTACTKGSGTLQMVDAGRFIKPLRDLELSCKPNSKVPNTLKISYSNISIVMEAVNKSLLGAIGDEVILCKSWMDNVHTAFGPTPKRVEIIRYIRDTIEMAAREGVMAGVNEDQISSALALFEKVSFNLVLQSVKKIIAVQNESIQLELLGRLDDKAMFATDNIMQITRKFITATIKRVEDTKNNWEARGSSENIGKQIMQHFNDLDTTLKNM